MAKIEKPQAVDDLEAIVGLCDAIMVARCVRPSISPLALPVPRVLVETAPRNYTCTSLFGLSVERQENRETLTFLVALLWTVTGRV